jgi:hypothetical protein
VKVELVCGRYISGLIVGWPIGPCEALSILDHWHYGNCIDILTSLKEGEDVQ